MNTEDVCEIGDFLKGGNYGGVYFSPDRKTVIKVPIGKVDENTMGRTSYPEVDSTCRINSPYLIKCLSIYPRDECRKGSDISYRLELCDGTVQDVLVTNPDVIRNISYTNYKTLFLTACLGIRHLHRNDLFHLDISTGNILYKIDANNKMISKIIDPGISLYTERDSNFNLLPIESKNLKVTITTRSPEIIEQQYNRTLRHFTYTDKVDIWSLGIMFLMFAANTSPDIYLKGYYHNDKNVLMKLKRDFGTPKDTDNTIIKYVRRSLIRNEEKISFTNLITGMLQYNPANRFSIEDVIDHPYFSIHPEGKTTMMKTPINFKKNIQSTLPNFSIDIPPVIRSSEPYNAKKMRGIELIRVICGNNRGLKTATYCLALDIYMRLSISITDDLPSSDFDTISMLSLRFADGIYNTINNSNNLESELLEMANVYPPGINGKNLLQNMVKHEGICLKFMKGIIKHHYFYNLCETMEEVVHIVDLIFNRKGNETLLSNYMAIDFRELVKKIREKNGTITSSPQTSKINNFGTFLDVQTRMKNEDKTVKKPPTPRMFKPVKTITKIDVLNKMVKVIYQSIEVYDVSTIGVMYDLFFSYISSITTNTSRMFKFLPEACVYLIHSMIEDASKEQIPEHLTNDSDFIYTMNTLKASPYFAFSLKSRYLNIFKTDEQILKFYVYVVFYNGDVIDSLEMYNSWDLEKINEELKTKPDVSLNLMYQIGVQP